MTRKIYILFFFLISVAGFAQRGKNGALTVTAANTIVNEYTNVTANATAGGFTITVASSTLNANGRFSSGLSAGDLVMIIQMQGASIDATDFGNHSEPNTSAWGAVTNYNNSGNYELKEVASVPNGTSISFTCALENSYTSAGKAQVIRIPRYTTLTINNPGVITGQAWNGTTGGVVAVEAQTSMTINTIGGISASAIGFRGGAANENLSFFGGSFFAAPDGGEGAEKGESIAGDWTAYDLVAARYGMGAPANGGGGGTAHNAGGGGGANAGIVASWNGNGNPDPTAGYVNAWNLEAAGFATNTSSGGGRGGYTWSNTNQNAGTTAPGNAAWAGDNRRIRGGLGGRPLDYSTGKIFMGGGGGAGDQNDGDAGGGGTGGGIVYLISHGTVGGTGTIIANGQNGVNSNNSAPSLTGYAGIDAAGGAGGGGTVMIQSSGTISGITINANGGTGGNQNFAAGSFASPTYVPAYGPGGGGGGGYIAISNGAITRNANAGNNGTTNSSGLTEFPPNGATRGAAGINNTSVNAYSLTPVNDTICSGQSASLSVNLTGTLPSGATINWYTTQFGTTSVNTGTTYSTPVLTGNTTYYVGPCPGFFRVAVVVTLNASPVIDTSAMVIADETCAGNDGGITGITVSGSSGYTYEWNSVSSPTADLTNTTSGSYTLVVTGSGGCTATAGPFTISTSGGPSINAVNLNIIQPTCGNNNGSITGLTASGGTGTLTYSWNGTTVTNPDITNLAPGSYTLTVTDASGCSTASGPHVLNSSSAPAANTSSAIITNATCGNSNGSITGITISGGITPYTFSWNGIPSATPDVTGLGAGNYTLIVTDDSGCTISAGPFTISATGGASINDAAVNITHTSCGLNNGSIIGINFTGGTAPFTIDYNGTIFPSTDISSLSAGSYTLTITDGSGCISTDGPYVINPSTAPVSSAIGTDPTCNGTSDGSATASVSGGNAPYTIQWIGGPSTAISNSLPAGTYTVVITDNSGCSDSSTVTLIDPPAIPLSVSGTTIICQGQSTTLTASGAMSYLWSTTETTSSITISPASSTTIIVTGSDGTCSESDTIPVTVNSLPVSNLSGDSIICTGEATTLFASGGTTFMWSTGETSASISVSPTAATNYSVIVSNNCGADTSNMNVNVQSPPIADAGADVTIALGNSTTLSPSGGIIYNWSPSTGLSCTNCSNPSASPTVTTTYTVIATDANGCSASDDMTITVDVLFVVFVPDAFSPDGNGNNDFLFVQGAGINEFTFRVYDRWGQVVFETSDLNNSWDGSFKGAALNSGAFVYTLEGTFLNGDKIDQKGSITLIR
jgi:gliding motility-associated-like protein